MAYTLTNLQDDIRNYTEVDSSVLSDTILTTIIKTLRTKFIENRTQMITDFMQHQT